MRAQTSLPSLGVAMVLLVVTTLFALTVASGGLAAENRAALERQSAMALSDRLVAADSPVTARANVLRAGALAGLTVADLGATYGLGPEAAVRVSLDGAAVLTTGSPDGGTTVERLVLVENRTAETITPRLASARTVTLPRRTSNVSVVLRPSGNATIETVRANGAIVLRDPSGLVGRYDVAVPRYETPRFAFEGSGNLTRGDVTIDYWPARTRKARLRVTVDRWGDVDG